VIREAAAVSCRQSLDAGMRSHETMHNHETFGPVARAMTSERAAARNTGLFAICYGNTRANSSPTTNS